MRRSATIWEPRLMDARDAGPGLAVSVRAEPRFTRGIDLGAHDADLLEVLPGDVAGGVCRASHRAQLLADADAAPRQADLVALLDAADEDDLRIARRLAQLVVERGYGSRSLRPARLHWITRSQQ